MSLFDCPHRLSRRFLTIVVGWSLINIAILTTVSEPSLFSMDDDYTSLLAATDPIAVDTIAEDGGEFSSDLFSDPSSLVTTDLDSSIFQPDSNSAKLDLDSSWLLTSDPDLASQEQQVSSCISDDSSSSSSTTQLFGKTKETRRDDDDNHPKCLQQEDPTSSSPSLKFPDLLNNIHIEQPGVEPPTKPMVDVETRPGDNDNPCPPLKRVHVCCAGPVEPEYPWTGLLKQVQNCQACMSSLFFLFNSFLFFVFLKKR